MLKRIAFVLLLLALEPGLATAGDTAAAQKSKDFGGQPWVVDIEKLTVKNPYFRSTSWTGTNLQMTVMSIQPGGEIGLERHEKNDQFIRVEQGRARVVMGKDKDRMTFDKKVSADWAIFIPAGYWHNITNIGDRPLKVYAIYAPPEHPPGTLHKTFEESEAAHGH